MIRYLILYILALAGFALGAFLPGVSFLTPISLALLLFGLLILWRLDGAPFRGLGFPEEARWLLQLGGGILIGAAVMVFMTGTLAWSDQISITSGEGIRNRLPQLIFYTFIYTALIAATEEIIFRGGYFQLFKVRYSILPGALVSAALWAILHLPGMAADQVPGEAMLYGLLTFLGFGVFLSLTKVIAGGSLWAPIGIHYGYNLAFSATGAFFAVEITGLPLFTGASGWVPETGLVGAMVWVGLAVLLGVRGRAWLQSRDTKNTRPKL